MDFNDYYWHDAKILNINIDRKNPGIKDTILFTIDFPDQGKVDFVFEEVYWANMNLNFNIVASENILDAFITEKDDKDLVAISSIWRKLIGDIDLSCFVIDLNSTGGKIKIIARGYQVYQLD